MISRYTFAAAHLTLLLPLLIPLITAQVANAECVETQKKIKVVGSVHKETCTTWGSWGTCDWVGEVRRRCPVTCNTCPTCSDIEGTFPIKPGADRTCSYIKKSDKKDKFCSKKNVSKNCPETCGLCEEECENLPKLKAPVTLRLVQTDDASFPKHTSFKRMFFSGGNALSDPNSCHAQDVMWKNQNNFWYLVVTPQLPTGKTCPIQGGGSHIGGDNDVNRDGSVDNNMTSTCNVYDFRLLISNTLTEEATVHYHGLTPPTPQDGVPLVTTPNIEPNSMQYYRFQQLTYSGMYWMHSHWGFQEALGIAAPIILQHDTTFLEANGIHEDLIVQLQNADLYPKCTFSGKYVYKNECAKVDETIWYQQMWLINNEEDPVELKPQSDTRKVRIRFLNAGADSPWNIYNDISSGTDCKEHPEWCKNASNHGNVAVQPLEIVAMDGNDVIRDAETNSFTHFFLGVANRIDVLVNVYPQKDTVITAKVNVEGGLNVYRYIIIRAYGRNPRPVDISKLPTYFQDSPDQMESGPAEIVEKLKAQHPLKPKPSSQRLRKYVIVNRGGDFLGGFPLSLHEGSLADVKTKLQQFVNDETNFKYPVKTYTELNNMKYQLHPFKKWYNAKKGISISSARTCNGCARGSYNGNEQDAGIIDYSEGGGITYPRIYKYPSSTITSNLCCWEWCDFTAEECDDFKLENATEYETNPHPIPVCYGDRVELSFLNYGFNAPGEGHPIHLHGHDFSVTRIYNINRDKLSLAKEFKDLDGPLMDTYWVTGDEGLAVTFEFDAFNPGEHLLHCHKDLHLLGGMLTTVRYMNDTDCNNEWLPTEYHGGGSKYPKQVYPNPTVGPSIVPTGNTPSQAPTTALPTAPPTAPPSGKTPSQDPVTLEPTI